MSSRSAALCVLPPEKRCERVMSSCELFVRSDADVIHASCGDPAEFGEIFRRYFPRVYAASDVAFLAPAVESISSRDQHFFHLMAYAELSPTEIATSLGIPAGTVRSRLHRIRRHLTKAFASKGA